jgi:S1-C subfamily serine protease
MASVGQLLRAAGLAVALSVAVAVRADTPPPTPASVTSDSVQSAERSVVRVVTVSLDAAGAPMGMDTGSGFAVGTGLVVTNHHMVQGSAGAAQVATFVIPERDAGGQSVRATVKQTWSDADLALLAAPGLTSPPMTITTTTPGKEAVVRAMGFPGVTDALRNLPLTEILRPQESYVTSGSIALFSRTAPGGAKIETIFHTAPINPGNSGGPLIDACGRVVGVNTWSAGSQLGDDGQMTTPQGQFIATQSSVLARFLGDAQVKALYASGPCVPASVQTLEDRLKGDEAAVAAQKDEITKLQGELQDVEAKQKPLGSAVAAIGAGLGLLVVAVVAWAVLTRPRARVRPKPGAE